MDKVDTHGHDVEQAKMHHPQLDVDAPPASEKLPEGDQIVRAQSPAEVEAQEKAVTAYQADYKEEDLDEGVTPDMAKENRPDLKGFTGPDESEDEEDEEE